MIFRRYILAAGALLLASACSSGGGGREVPITATDDGCTPATIEAKAGEKLTFVVRNDAKSDRELEGIEGTRLEEILVPAGRTRKVNYTVPASAGAQKLKCYVPGGPSTIIELQVEGASTEPKNQGSLVSGKQEPFDTTVNVVLSEWLVNPSVSEVKAGRIRFVARNVSGDQVHELAVLSVARDGQKRELAEVEGLKAGETGEFIVALKAGRYELACLTAKGEWGSTEDHYQKGMYTSFTVR